METIKFRGFNKKRNEWIYGFYLQNRGHHFVCPDEFANDKTWEDYEVDPETVGQFIGVHDKNGFEIYSGDVVKIDEDTDVFEAATVVYNKKHARYIAEVNSTEYMTFCLSESYYEVVDTDIRNNPKSVVYDRRIKDNGMLRIKDTMQSHTLNDTDTETTNNNKERN